LVRLFLGFLMLFAIGGAVAGIVTYLRVKEETAVTASLSPTATPAFVELEPINVPVQRDDEVPETRTYIFVLETRPGLQEKVALQRLRLRDSYTKYLTALASRAGPENIENVPYLKGQLQGAANDILGPNVVQGVLIRSVLSNIAG
jgi:hypothetical protein